MLEFLRELYSSVLADIEWLGSVVEKLLGFEIGHRVAANSWSSDDDIASRFRSLVCGGEPGSKPDFGLRLVSGHSFPSAIEANLLAWLIRHLKRMICSLPWLISEGAVTNE
jgi:hypothetical protein